MLEFSDFSGAVTDVGRLISEELVTKLFSTGQYKVVERFLLNKAIAEHKLQLQGFVDPKSAKELGKVLGVDSIVSGTITDLSMVLRVNARLISTETGEVFSVGAVTIPKNDSLASLGQGSDPKAGKGKFQFPFREDFSQYEDDARSTDWGKNGRVKIGEDGRKWLMPTGNGPQPVGLDFEMPDIGYVEFDFVVQVFGKPPDLFTTKPADRERMNLLSGVSFVDEAGVKYRIEWTIKPPAVFGDVHIFQLPGASPQSLHTGRGDGGNGTVYIRKSGNKLTLTLKPSDESNAIFGGSKETLTGNLSEFKKLCRFEVDLYKSQHAMLSITNVKVGKGTPQAKLQDKPQDNRVRGFPGDLPSRKRP